MTQNYKIFLKWDQVDGGWGLGLYSWQPLVAVLVSATLLLVQNQDSFNREDEEIAAG